MSTFTRPLLFLIISLIGISLSGQTSAIGYTIGLKGGANGAFESYGSFGLDLNLTAQKFVYSVGYNYNPEFDIFIPNPPEDLYQANFLFGSFLDRKSFRFEYQGGIGMIWGTHRTDLVSTGFVDKYDSEEFETISLPIRGSVKYIPFQFMSVGLEVLVNINREKTFAVPMLTLNFGSIFKEKRTKITNAKD